MRRLGTLIILAFAVSAGAAGGYWYAHHPIPNLFSAPAAQMAATGEKKILYYRHPSSEADYSATPKQDDSGRDYIPVYEDAEVSFDPPPKAEGAASSGRKIAYYRNPMGLPDTSPVPKKDWMGMDYIAVYDGDEPDDGKTIKVSLDKVQRSGVRTEPVAKRVIVHPVRAARAVTHDETRLTVVSMRSEGYIEELFVARTGQHVTAGEPLFRVYSAQIQQAQTDLLVAMRASQRSVPGMDSDRSFDGAMQRLRNLGVPEQRIREVRETGQNPRTIDWPSPATGDVIEKRVLNGQRVSPGEELFRIADHSHVWVIADVAEADLAVIKPGSRATVTLRAYPTEPVEGAVTLIYPQLRVETRTARVRIELPNLDYRFKMDMYADVLFRPGTDDKAVIAVPINALIDSGTRQVVLIAKGEGRFEPRAVKLGRRGEGYVEIVGGIEVGEEIVTAATFLIDAESNLRAALQSFTQPETPK